MHVVILAGGRGTRLPVSAADIPKALVEVHGKPILAWQMERLRNAGFSNIRLALGFRAEKIIAYLARQESGIDYVVEPQPLGTGGAVRFATRDISGPVMVLNGDTFADFDFAAIASSHEPGHAVIVAHWKENVKDFGLLEIEGDRVRAFCEKPEIPTPGNINAGVYIFDLEHRASIPEGFAMLETDLLPRLAAEGKLKAHQHRGYFDDLGTEERLARVRNSPFPFTP